METSTGSARTRGSVVRALAAFGVIALLGAGTAVSARTHDAHDAHDAHGVHGVHDGADVLDTIVRAQSRKGGDGPTVGGRGEEPGTVTGRKKRKPPKGKKCPPGADWRGGMCRVKSEGGKCKAGCSIQASPGGECSCEAKDEGEGRTPSGDNREGPAETQTPSGS